MDPGAQQRLTGRFGTEVADWFQRLPPLLIALAEHWQFEFEEAIPRGTVSVVFRCRLADGRGAVLKVSPDLPRIASEVSALDSWVTTRVPQVFAFDGEQGALLIESVEPGTPLAVTSAHPGAEEVAELLRDLHASGLPKSRFRSVEQRVTSLFDSSLTLYTRRPELSSLVQSALYERGRRLAERLASGGPHGVLLHGDLTPSNVLDGGLGRGLVAVDPAPCIGDPAFDAIDLILWQADDLDVVRSRIRDVVGLVGFDAERLEGWCVAFAAMAALELASEGEHVRRRGQIEALLQLAAQAPAT